VEERQAIIFFNNEKKVRACLEPDVSRRVGKGMLIHV